MNALDLSQLPIALLCLGLLAGGTVSCSHDDDEAGHEAGDEHVGHEDHGGPDDHDDEDTHDEAVDEHAGHDENEEDLIELTDRQLEAADIQVSVVGPGEIDESLSLSAVVTPNLDAVLHVNPRVPGIISSIEKHLGERVEKGDLLCTLDSVELGAAAADYLRANALVDAAEETLAQSRALFKLRLETSQRMLDGVIEVNQSIYDLEKELQAKAVSTVRPMIEAERTLKNSILERDSVLAELAAERDAKLLEAEVQLREKSILATAATNRLSALGVQTTGIDQDSPLLHGSYEIHATQQGIVTERHITPGEFVDAENELYTIQDLSSVWVVASAYETELRKLSIGQNAVVRLNAFPEQEIAGEVSMVEYKIDPHTRSVGVRIVLDNRQLDTWAEEYPLRPGMFGRVDVITSRRQAAIVIPESALAHGDDGDAVFVEERRGVFEKRHVQVRAGAGGLVEVLSGLEAGERIATSQTFMLKSIERQAELGGGHSH